MDGAPPAASDPLPRLQALREQGAAARDPVGWSRIEALARRAQAHQGPTRKLLDDKLRALLDAAAAQPAVEPPAPNPRSPQRDTLADLLAHLARHSGEPASATRAPGSPPAPLRSVRRDRRTWARLSVDQRMKQSRQRVPDNAGPLNTQRLLHQALTLMRAASPDYVHRFIAHVEALLQLDPHGLADIGLRKEAARPPREPRKTGGTRSG